MVHYGRRSGPSARALADKLEEAGYSGPAINFGLSINPEALNKPEAIQNASNKRVALQLMCEAEVPTPKLVEMRGDVPLLSPRVADWPLVGRPDSHRQGRGFWYCEDSNDVARAIIGTKRKAKATHFMEYIDADREFRVHVVNGKSIKISEKVGGTGLTRNHGAGFKCQYPHDFNHKKTLRKVAKNAVEALGLDFGAVDILWKDNVPFVLEVNTAPCLTDANSDTLQRYVSAFMEEFNNKKEGENSGNDDGVGVQLGDNQSLLVDLVTSEHHCNCEFCERSTEAVWTN